MKDDLLHVRLLGQQNYHTTWQAMRSFTETRDCDTPDELWLLEHMPVFTQGQNGKPEHLLKPGDIPIIQTDRGGQITYHGPGQLMIYTLIDLKRKRLTVTELVTRLEQSMVNYLNTHNIHAYSKCGARGIYTCSERGVNQSDKTFLPSDIKQEESKIASIGLRIRRGCSYHGLAFNVAMDLEPFTRINPCGFSQLKMSQLIDFVPHVTITSIHKEIIEHLKNQLHYTTIHTLNQLPGCSHGQ